MKKLLCVIFAAALLLTSCTPAVTVTPTPDVPTIDPITTTGTPTDTPTVAPTDEPTAAPTDEPTAAPTDKPTTAPTDEPTVAPTDESTAAPTDEPAVNTTAAPIITATAKPTATSAPVKTATPTVKPTTTPAPSDTVINFNNGTFLVVNRLSLSNNLTASPTNNVKYYSNLNANTVNASYIVLRVKTGANGYTNNGSNYPYVKFAVANGETGHTGSMYIYAKYIADINGNITQISSTNKFPNLPANFDGYVLFDLSSVKVSGATMSIEGDKIISTKNDSTVLTNTRTINLLQAGQSGKGFDDATVQLGGVGLINLSNYTPAAPSVTTAPTPTATPTPTPTPTAPPVSTTLNLGNGTKFEIDAQYNFNTTPTKAGSASIKGNINLANSQYVAVRVKNLTAFPYKAGMGGVTGYAYVTLGSVNNGHTGSFYIKPAYLVTTDGKVTAVSPDTGLKFPAIPASFDGYVLFAVNTIAIPSGTTKFQNGNIVSTKSGTTYTNSYVCTQLNQPDLNASGARVAYGGIAAIDLVFDTEVTPAPTPTPTAAPKPTPVVLSPSLSFDAYSQYNFSAAPTVTSGTTVINPNISLTNGGFLAVRVKNTTSKAYTAGSVSGAYAYIMFKNVSTGGNVVFYINPVYLVSKNGVITDVAASTGQQFPSIPASFDGYILYDIATIKATGSNASTVREGDKLYSVVASDAVITDMVAVQFNQPDVSSSGATLAFGGVAAVDLAITAATPAPTTTPAPTAKPIPQVSLTNKPANPNAAKPTIIRLSPENGSTLASDFTPALFASFDSAVGIDPSRCSLKIDGTAVKYVIWEDDNVTGIAPMLSLGQHTITLTVTDKNNRSTTATSTFTIKALNQFNFYRGEIHSHTQESDGNGTIDEAYTYARDFAHFDFFAVTDHSQYYDWTEYSQKMLPVTDKYTVDGKYVALHGFEVTWGHLHQGHANVIMPGKMYDATKITLADYYEMLRTDTGIGHFNHPDLTYGKFEDFGHRTNINDESMALYEFQGTTNFLKNYGDYYFQALDLGWHLSPTYNEDNHAKQWGNTTPFHTVIMADELTVKGVTEALHQGRTYITDDNTLELTYTVNGTTLGGTVVAGRTVRVRVELKTQRATGLGKVEVLGNNGAVLAILNPYKAKTAVWEFDIPADSDYMLLRVTDNGVNMLSAPIYIEHEEIIDVTSAITGLAADGKHALKVDFTVREKLNNVKVEYWIGERAYTNVTGAPAATVNVGTVNSTGTATGKVTFAASNKTFITARISGTTVDGRSVSYITGAFMSPLYITEVVPMTSNSNGYAYFELYNNTNSAIDLSKYKVGLFGGSLVNLGQAISGGYTFASGTTIAAKSTLVVWICPNASLTVAQFNSNYGTNLVEGTNIIKITGKTALPTSTYHRTTLVVVDASSSAEITRVSYNYEAALMGKEFEANKALNFSYHVRPSKDQPRFETKVTATPGTVKNGQIPVI